MEKLISDQFMKLIIEDMEIHRNTYLYETMIDDHKQKLDAYGSGYYEWLSKLLNYLKQKYSLPGNIVLDLGCGTGEMAVWMRKIGYNAFGTDLHNKHISFAQVLANENKLDKNMFILSNNGKLPFDDKSIDIVTMFSVLEHMDDKTFVQLQKEISRICRGVVFVLVPNLLKPADDHTGLWFVPWMPSKIAVQYLKIRGTKYSYFISGSGKWDVCYRTLKQISKLTKDNFNIDFVPDELVFPSLGLVPPVTNFSKKIKLFGKDHRFGIKLPVERLSELFSVNKQYFYKYLNFVLTCK